MGKAKAWDCTGSIDQENSFLLGTQSSDESSNTIVRVFRVVAPDGRGIGSTGVWVGGGDGRRGVGRCGGRNRSDEEEKDKQMQHLFGYCQFLLRSTRYYKYTTRARPISNYNGGLGRYFEFLIDLHGTRPSNVAR